MSKDITMLQKSINEVGMHAVRCCIPEGYKILQCTMHGSYVGNDEYKDCPLCHSLHSNTEQDIASGNGTDSDTIYYINNEAKEVAHIDELVSRATGHCRHY